MPIESFYNERKRTEFSTQRHWASNRARIHCSNDIELKLGDSQVNGLVGDPQSIRNILLHSIVDFVADPDVPQLISLGV